MSIRVENQKVNSSKLFEINVNSAIFHSILVDSDSLMASSEHLNVILDHFLCIKLKNLKINVSHTKLFLKVLKVDHN